MRFFCDNQRHLVCIPFSVENLHKMARILQIAPGWFHSGAKYPHYDIPKRRVAEIQAKCTVISPRALLSIVKGEVPKAEVICPDLDRQDRLNDPPLPNFEEGLPRRK